MDAQGISNLERARYSSSYPACRCGNSYDALVLTDTHIAHTDNALYKGVITEIVAQKV